MMKEKENKKNKKTLPKLSNPTPFTKEHLKQPEEVEERLKEQELTEYPIEKDFNPSNIDKYLFSFNTHEIFVAFDKLMKKHKYFISSKEYWYALRQAYTDSDAGFFHNSKTFQYFTAHVDNREYLMSTSERSRLIDLPEKVQIFRAVTKMESEAGRANPKEYGISWTLSKKVANFFAKKYIGNTIYLPGMKEKIVLKRTVITRTIPKEKIIAYFNDRKEEEIIYFPWL